MSRLAIAAIASLALAVVFAASASADPAICDQYSVGLPQCSQGTTGGEETGGSQNPGGGNGDQGGAANPAAGGDADSSAIPSDGAASAGAPGGSDGTLPFTGYPITPLALILLTLLLAGLTLRAYLAIRERLRGRSTPTPTPAT